MRQEHYDVAIVGGGPAGLQTALILARTRKRLIIFDAPEPPRNGASHGVHNFVGLDGLLPSEIREQAWRQIDVYNSAELCVERVVDVQAHEAGFAVSGEAGTSVTARHVVLALGYRDVLPDIPGFIDCWGDTIVSCPFCDGYENRDRVWGLVASSPMALEHMPKAYRNWTTEARVIVWPNLTLSEEQRAALNAQSIPVHSGEIVDVHHHNGKIEAVTLSSGERVAVGTLWWRPDEAPQPLTEKLIANFNLEVDDNGYIETDGQYQTAIQGLWAVGDVKGWATAIGAAYQASQAAYAIAHQWYTNHNQS
ncbi:MAG: NAD(P)/FAD-dependent oxidoreductase [Ardenticatenaceae bacterium]|nr:NAD(P)/FAD-dependent oxidoreductase [Ardenticatenaceae bacterium]